MFLIKLGGSIITKKSQKNTFNPQVMNQLAVELQSVDEQMVLIHGAGSFGHILAKHHHLNDGYSNDSQLLGFAQTHALVQQLNSYVLTSLHEKKIPAVSLSPHSFLTLDNHRPFSPDVLIFTYYLKHGFTPVTFGDVILDKSLRFSICSGDLLIQLLAESLNPSKVIFVIDEDGIYTDNPKQNPDAQLIESATIADLKHLTTSPDDHADVTKGMQGKIETIKHIAALGIDTVLVNGNIHNRLADTLHEKKTISTIVYGEHE